MRIRDLFLRSSTRRRLAAETLAQAVADGLRAWEAEHRICVCGAIVTAAEAAEADARRAAAAAHRTCACGAVVTIWRTFADGRVRCVPCATKLGPGAH